MVDNFSAFDLQTPENFISLLYYLGLITLDRYERGELILKIPNNTIRVMMAEYIRRALSESGIFTLPFYEFGKHARNFAFDQKLELFHFLAEHIERNSSVRDYIDGESFIKGFLVAHLINMPFYAVMTERERNKGFIDIYMSKAPNIFDDIPNILIELKYIKRGDFSENLLDKKIEDAKEQLTRYSPTENEFAVILIYHGWELVYCEKWSNEQMM